MEQVTQRREAVNVLKGAIGYHSEDKSPSFVGSDLCLGSELLPLSPEHREPDCSSQPQAAGLPANRIICLKQKISLY